jgi:NhaP-type Na+/H+ or K+/H+ antiporter
MLSTELLIICILLAIMVFCLFSKRINQSPVTLPIIFTTLGYAISGPIHSHVGTHQLIDIARIVAEITLILVLFSDASHVQFSRLKSSYQIPLRMLLIGLPLTILFGTAVIYMLSPATGWSVALLTAAILSPTDAALGQTVVSSKDVPPRLSQAINVESGLNDGLALPFVLIGAFMAEIMSTAGVGNQGLPMTVVLQITLGPMVGIAVGWLASRLLDLAQDRGWVETTSQGILFLATAFLAYFTSEIVGGNGFIAAFVAGAVFGNFYRHDINFISEFIEGDGQILTMFAFIIFGAVLLPLGLEHLSLMSVIVGMLFLTVVRMLPIWISLHGMKLAPRDKLFLGWFGPRGLASILFVLIVVDEFEIPGEEELLACVVMTVLFSIILHGVSASPLAKRMGNQK